MLINDVWSDIKEHRDAYVTDYLVWLDCGVRSDNVPKGCTPVYRPYGFTAAADDGTIDIRFRHGNSPNSTKITITERIL